MKRILFTTFLLTSVGCLNSVAKASFDISAEYVPTLTKEFDSGNSNINSAYNMEFVLGTSSDYDIKYYKLNDDNSITEVYYKISQSVNLDANGVYLLRNQYSATEGYFKGLSSGGQGGALDLIGRNLGDIYADFIGNNSPNYGGAIFLQNSSINSITGDFIGNYSKGTGNAYGGAIWLQPSGSIGTITSNFIGNYADGGRYNLGGAIHNEGIITRISGNFIGNYVKASAGSIGIAGGAIHNTGSITEIFGDFIGNYITSNAHGSGGAIEAGGNGSLGSIVGNFIGNYISAANRSYGGAINLYGTSINGDINGSFINNYAITSSNSFLALGGAVISSKNVGFTATDKDNIFTGNYTQDKRGKLYNALFVRTSVTSSPTATFSVANSKSITINDNISGGAIINSDTDIDYSYTYNLEFNGDGTGSININNDIINAGNVSVNDTTLKFGSFTHQDTSAVNYDGKGAFKPGVGTDAVTNLSLNNAMFDINNGYLETINLKSFISNNSYLSIDVNPDTMTSDVLNVAGDINGTTKLIVNASSNKDIRGQGSILFAESTNDTIGSDTSFEIYRVYGSPYLYDVIFNDLGGNSKEWSFAMNSNVNPDGGYVKTNAEVISYIGLHSAAVEQTRSMVDSIKLKIAENKVDCGVCAIYDVRYNMKPLKNVWVSPIYFNSNVKVSSNVETDISGLEAGFDIQQDAHNKLGVFASYRKGHYDLNGIGKRYRSPVGSDIEIDSYIGGLYYRYDMNRFWLFSTVYGGVQQADISTKDGMRANSDASQVGASVDFGYLFALKNKYTLEPNVGLSYTLLDFDRIVDNAGKTADFDKLGYGEVKVGLKLEKTYYLSEGPAKIYVEPSVIQPFVKGNKVAISAIGDVDTYDSSTLGRIEIGGRIALKDGLSAYSSANYTIGSDYDAKSVAVGLNYAW